MNKTKTINTNKNLEYFLLLSWIACLLSIGVIVQNPLSLKLNNNTENILYFIKLLRFFSPTIIFPILLLLFLKLKKNYNKFICTFFLYGFWQISIYLILRENLDILQNYQIILNLFSTLLIFQLSTHLKKVFITKLLYVFIFFIFLIFLFFSNKLLLEIINYNNLFLYKTLTLQPGNLYSDQEVPRITGLSRMAVVLFSFTFLYIETLGHKYLKIFGKLVLFFLVILIYAFNTRTGLLGLIIFFLFYFIFFKKKLIKKIKDFFLIILLPIFIYEALINFKLELLKKENLQILNQYNNNEISSYNFNRVLSYQGSSGRTQIWKNSLTIIIENNIIFGAGPQADRKLINIYQKQNNESIQILENNSSNALIYSYLCGGIISLSLFIFIYFLIFKEIIINLILKKVTHMNNFIINFSLFNLIFLSIRSVFENSFAHFGIDFCLLCVCYFILITKSDNLKIDK